MRSGTSGCGANISRNLRLDKDRCKAQSKRLVLASGWVFDQRNAVKGWLLISMNDHTEKTNYKLLYQQKNRIFRGNTDGI